MKSFFGLLLLMSFFVLPLEARAEAYRREVSFEWEEIPDAKSYDLEIKQVVKEGGIPKNLTFKTKEASWSGKLIPGKYTMSLRSRDFRGVPGDWSPESEFDVSLDPVKIKSPAQQATVKSDDASEVSQTLEWNPVSGADQYHLELTSEDGKTKITETLKETSYTAKIPVAQNYTWKISASDAAGNVSESPTTSQFSVLGKKIATPKITQPDSEFVRELKWTKPENVDKYDVVLSRYDAKTKNWEKVLTQQNVTGESFAFDNSLPGGTYSLHVTAKGNLRETSEMSRVTFKAIDGDRSPEAEYTALVRKSIDRVTGWYGVASYLITQINYEGETPETGGRTTTSAVGGTGRLGLGYFSKDPRWGFLGIADMSGFTISGGNHTYSSVELSGIRRYVEGERGELRLIFGAYYKELPQLIGVPNLANPNAPQLTFVQSAVVGPHVGAEYWYSMTPKLGLQVNAHLYDSLITAHSPNGNNVQPTISYQLGLMGSYRFSNRFTGLMGITHRLDQVQYEAIKSNTSPLQAAGDLDKTKVTGDYLSFYAEYGF